MAGINFNMLINTMSDDFFAMAKRLFSENAERYGRMKHYKAVEVLLNVLCKQNHLDTLGRIDFAAIISSLFYDEVESAQSISEYIILLNDEISDAKNNYYVADGSRAQKYANVVASRYVARAKDRKYDFSDKEDLELLEDLCDYVNVVLALYKQHCMKQNRMDLITEVDLKVEDEYFTRFISNLFDTKSFFDENDQPEEKAGKLPKKMVGAINDWHLNQVNTKLAIDEKRLFAYLLTTLLYLRICETRGYTPEVTL